LGIWFVALGCGFGVSRLGQKSQALALVAILLTGVAARRHDQGSVDGDVFALQPAAWARDLAGKTGQNSRVVGLGNALQPNTGALAGLRDLRGYDLPVSRDWERFSAQLDPRLQRPDFPIASYQQRNAGPLAFAGVRYLISEAPIQGLSPVESAPAPIYISELPEPGHRAWLADGATVANSQEMAFRAVVGDRLARARPPIEGLSKGWPGRGIEAVEVHEARPEDIRISVSTDTERMLVFADAWSPGWQVEVDGEQRTLYRAGGYFKAVRVLPGDREVRFLYKPKGWAWGWRLSVLGLSLMGWLLSRRIRSQMRPAI
jgi:hypothetical protein